MILEFSVGVSLKVTSIETEPLLVGIPLLKASFDFHVYELNLGLSLAIKPRNESSRGDFCYFESSRLRVESEFITSSRVLKT